jgi:hypothetical protein
MAAAQSRSGARCLGSNGQQCTAAPELRQTALGTPTDIDQLHQRITSLEQKNVHLTRQLEERDLELDAARAANRELICTLNYGS